MIPDTLNELVERQLGNVNRINHDDVKNELSILGVPIESEFAEFFLKYKITLFVSDVSDEQLCDISKPTKEITDGTNFVHEVWGVPGNYICLTSCEGEGAYLYDRETGKVWDFDLESRDEFLAGNQHPMFDSFFEFMIWYLGGSSKAQ